ncbi:MAG: hypothetical protein ACOYOB_20060, partial [Myxococcota bacterium]
MVVDLAEVNERSFPSWDLEPLARALARLADARRNRDAEPRDSEPLAAQANPAPTDAAPGVPATGARMDEAAAHDPAIAMVFDSDVAVAVFQLVLKTAQRSDWDLWPRDGGWVAFVSNPDRTTQRFEVVWTWAVNHPRTPPDLSWYDARRSEEQTVPQLVLLDDGRLVLAVGEDPKEATTLPPLRAAADPCAVRGASPSCRDVHGMRLSP